MSAERSRRLQTSTPTKPQTYLSWTLQVCSLDGGKPWERGYVVYTFCACVSGYCLPCRLHSGCVLVGQWEQNVSEERSPTKFNVSAYVHNLTCKWATACNLKEWSLVGAFATETKTESNNQGRIKMISKLQILTDQELRFDLWTAKIKWSRALGGTIKCSCTLFSNQKSWFWSQTLPIYVLLFPDFLVSFPDHFRP